MSDKSREQRPINIENWIRRLRCASPWFHSCHLTSPHSPNMAATPNAAAPILTPFTAATFPVCCAAPEPAFDPEGVADAGVVLLGEPVAAAVGRLDMGTPARWQMSSTAGAISNVRRHVSYLLCSLSPSLPLSLSLFLFSLQAIIAMLRSMHGRAHVLAISCVEHFPGTQLRMDFSIDAAPVVHWHLLSVKLQPEAGTAAAKHVNWFVNSY